MRAYFLLAGLILFQPTRSYAEFPDTGITSYSPNRKYAIWSRIPWYWKPPLGLLMVVTQRQIPLFQKTSMIDEKGHKIFHHVEWAGDWSPDSECFAGRNNKGHLTLYFPLQKKKIKTSSFIWAKGKDDFIYLIDYQGWGPANERAWASENPKDREIYFSRLSLQNPKPQKIATFTIPRKTQAIVCMVNCDTFIRFGYRYSVFKNDNPVLVNDPAWYTTSHGRVVFYNLFLKNAEFKFDKDVKASLGGGAPCDCTDTKN